MELTRVSGTCWIVRRRVWTTLLLLAPFAVVSTLTAPIFAAGSPLDQLFRALGWICFSAGALFRWWATLYVGGKKNEALAIDGPYSICRNPLYVGSFLIALSVAFMSQSPIFAIGLCIAAPIYFSITVSWEEAKLQAAFGTEFDRYRARVPKFIPRFSLLSAPTTIVVSRRGLRAELLNTLTWMWIPPLAEAVSQLRRSAWWPEIQLWP